MKKILTSIFAAAFLVVGYAQTAAHAQTISASEAIERALATTGGGTVNSLELLSDPAEGSVYRIVISGNAMRFEVIVSAATGGIVRLNAGDAAVPPRGTAHGSPHTQVVPQGEGIIIGVVRPRHPARPGGPVNPPISAQRAVEIARDHLVSTGVTNARFDYVYMDIERGRWVWSVEFNGARGREYEFYIDVSTGHIVKFEID